MSGLYRVPTVGVEYYSDKIVETDLKDFMSGLFTTLRTSKKWSICKWWKTHYRWVIDDDNDVMYNACLTIIMVITGG